MTAHGQHRTSSRAAARLTAIGTVAALTVLGLWQAVPATTPTPTPTTTSTTATSTTTTTVDTWADLKADLAAAGTGTVQLGSNITQSSGDYLTVPAGSSPTLDLNGKTLQITSPGWNNFPQTHAAVGVPVGAGLTITSSSPGGSLTATGGGGSAGIGGHYTPDYGSAGSSAGDVTIRGGSVTATGGPSYYGPYYANGGAAGIGGGLGGAGGSVTVSGGSVTATAGGQDQSNGADFGGAGIGGGFEGAGGSVTVSGGSVTATGASVTGTGASGGAGIGSGGWKGFGVPVPSAGSVTVSGGSVTATGGNGGAGIGGGANGPGGSVVIGAGAQVTASDDRPPALNAWDKPRYASAIGGGATDAGGTAPLGSLSNAGSLTLPGIYSNGAPDGAPYQAVDEAVLYVTDGVTVENSGTIHGPGVIKGSGTVHNTGSISFGSDWANITGNSFHLIFAITGAADWDWQWVSADTVAHAGWTLENPPTSQVTLYGSDETTIYWSPPANSVFVGWFTAPTGGTQITDTTNLHDLAGDGPAQVRLWSRYLQMQTITFPTIANQTYGAADIDPGATASSSLPVSYTTATPTVCTIASGKVHIIAAGTCTITAQQPGDDITYGPAQQVNRSFTIAKAPITVTGHPATVLTSLLGATFTVDVTNAITGAPAVREPVTVSATTMLGRAVHCTGLTNTAGTAHCTIRSLLPLKTGRYQINVAETSDYLPGSGIGDITLLGR